MRSTFAALFAALLTFGLTACGGDSVALDPVAEAATKTGAAESMRIEMTHDHGRHPSSAPSRSPSRPGASLQASDPR